MQHTLFLLQNPWRKNSDFIFPRFSRDIEPELQKNLGNNLIIGLIGSRQVGKSSLLFRMIEFLLNSGVPGESIFYFNLDDIALRELFDNPAHFIEFVGTPKKQIYVFLDEVQRLESPGLFLKELFDLSLPIKIVYSGSSQLELKSKVKENLVGRARNIEIERLSLNELVQFNGPMVFSEALNLAIIYGGYPGVALENNSTDKQLRLRDIYQSYIEKDIIDFVNIDNPDLFNKLMIVLASTTGTLLNIEIISKTLRAPRDKIEKYISILESTFTVKRVYPFYKNYKKEIIKTPKIYFLDNGLRNYILKNFNALELRDDIGHLFETLVFTELTKNDFYKMNSINYWRTTNQTEIDFIMKKQGKQYALEVKFNKTATPKSFSSFNAIYPGTLCTLINKENLKSFIADTFGNLQ